MTNLIFITLLLHGILEFNISSPKDSYWKKETVTMQVKNTSDDTIYFSIEAETLMNGEWKEFGPDLFSGEWMQSLILSCPPKSDKKYFYKLSKIDLDKIGKERIYRFELRMITLRDCIEGNAFYTSSFKLRNAR